MDKKLLRPLLVTSSVLWLSGCGVIDHFYLPPPEDTAQELFETANDYMAEKDYVAAIQRYNKLRESYPFSPYALDAELSLADAYFLDKEYASAVEAYKDFESLHPRHKAVPYVLYQIGVSRLNGFMSIDRPTNELQEGYEYLNRLIQTFPNSEYDTSAKEMQLQIRKLMAEHELYIADVFWHMNQYGPAWRRYTFVVETYPDVPDVSAHAASKITTAYHMYRQTQAKNVRQAREGSWKRWFRWL